LIMKVITALILLSLAVLSTCALAQENTTGYWMDKAEELTYNSSFEEVISALDEALKIDPRNETILIRKASYLNVVNRVNESSETYEKALALLDEDLKKDPMMHMPAREATVLRNLNRQNESRKKKPAHSTAPEGPERYRAWIGKGTPAEPGKWDEVQDAYNKAKRSIQDYRWESGSSAEQRSTNRWRLTTRPS
jgi:tetratricopeptide (TPR) repeat protein